MLVETGQTSELEQESTNAAFDFTVPAILGGRGYNEANIFVDANNALVSFVTKITPSPDWFVGVDSLKVNVQLPQQFNSKFKIFSLTQSSAKMVLGWTAKQ